MSQLSFPITPSRQAGHVASRNIVIAPQVLNALLNELTLRVPSTLTRRPHLQRDREIIDCGEDGKGCSFPGGQPPLGRREAQIRLSDVYSMMRKHPVVFQSRGKSQAISSRARSTKAGCTSRGKRPPSAASRLTGAGDEARNTVRMSFRCLTRKVFSTALKFHAKWHRLQSVKRKDPD